MFKSHTQKENMQTSNNQPQQIKQTNKQINKQANKQSNTATPKNTNTNK